MATKKIALSTQEYSLLRVVVQTTGEYENEKNQETPTPRRLNGEESSQRRHFLGKINPLFDEADVARKAIVEPAEKEWKEKNPRVLVGEGLEPERVWEMKMQNALNSNKELEKSILDIYNEKKEIEVTEKTYEFVKKYFVLFGNEAGWLPGDDEKVVVISNEFGIASAE